MKKDQKYPIRVLHRGMSYNKGGIETFIMNLYRNIDREKIQFDFIVPEGMDIAFEEEIKKLGGNIYKVICGIKKNPIKALLYDWKFFKKHPEISILHIHDCSAANLRLMKTAKKMGIKIRILHSHNNDYLTPLNKRQLITEKWNKKNINKIATDLFACSDEAGKFMFEKNSYKVVKNAVNANKFLFNQDKREQLRKELGINNELVIGCVARFDYQKNHMFLLDVFSEYLKIETNSKLLLIGDGPLKEKINNKILKLGIEEKVILLGMRDNIDELLNCLDLFILPSLSEGLGIVFIEAQINGLKCLASDNVPQETNILGNITYKSLFDSIEDWVKEIKKMTKALKREKVDLNIIKEKGYDICYESKKIEEFYLKKIRENE
nr:glycosyltransferase [uncultured Fusobacterium sp.]